MSKNKNTPLLNPDISIDWLRRNSTGKGVDVAVIDSGVDATHPDLQHRVTRTCHIEKVAGTIGVEEKSVRESFDNFGHGTGVAGVVSSIAPEVNIIDIKVLNKYNACTGDVLIEGIRWALDQRIKLINMSLATIKSQWVKPLFELCEQAYLQDAILVVSRRNVGPIGFPAMFSSVISVEMGLLDDPFNVIYKTANLVECDAYGAGVRVPAPGGGYVEQTGTSFATPHITGLIALMLQQWPKLLSVEAKAVLRSIAKNVV